ncbi:MAG TPA: hypothetical protein DHW34_01480 [Actinobacteria bacterium]|nr:hypothetical protein [Actinomycetota bacterium]HCK78668.1 hypothetical protein [Actinomycetota bacterium]
MTADDRAEGWYSSRSILVAVVAEALATVVFLVWVLFITKTTSFGEGDTYGWGAWVKNIPAMVAMFTPPLVGLSWGQRALEKREPNASVAVVLSGLSLFWALLITHYAGVVSAFGDTADWLGFWLFLGKIVIAAAVTAAVWRRGKKSQTPPQMSPEEG